MTLVWMILGSWAITLCRHDLERRLLPNVLTLPAVVGALIGGVVYADTRWWCAVVVTTAVYLVGYLAHGYGGGDVKLAAVCASLVGDPARVVLMVLCANLVSGVVATLSRRRQIAHGPSLLVAVALAL